jgi:hypothetical protein
MENIAQIETGTLYADKTERTVSGLLLPYGEQGKTNLGKFSIAPGAVTLPDDPSVVTLNVQHNREEPVGRAVELTSTAAGVVGQFKIAATAEGDQVLDDIATGKRAKLSAEVKNIVIRSGAAVAGVLFGAAVVEEGAFPSAALFAADTPEEILADPDAIVETDDDDTIGIVADVAPDDIGVVTMNEDGTVVETIYTPETTTETEPTTTNGETPMGATAPDTLAATKAAPSPATLNQVINDMTSAYRSGSRSLFAEVVTRPEGRAATNLFAALTDVEYNSVGSVGVAAIQPAWIDELWSGRAYARKFIPLIGSGQLSAITVNAWRWTTKPAVATWTGNKNAVPSNAPATESYEVTATRLAGAHDIAREYRDFGNTSFFDSYLRAMTESYAKLSDEKALDDLVGAATVVAASGAGVWDRIVDGIEAVIDTTVPTFAIVANNMYRELLTTSNNDALAYLNASVGIESGTAAGFTIVPSASLSAGQVLVGSREAAIAYELPGSPVRVEGLDMVNGGIDVGLFGYYATVINSESALALVETD